jgi:ABC-type polysaccharide/polyol phosphate transport system ATPase subunit
MDGDLLVEAERVSKAYTIWSSPAARLHGPMLGQIGQMPFLPAGTRKFCQRLSHEAFRNFYALQDVSLGLKRGESVGIIGRNGCGKSTLLQIIAGTLAPTGGRVSVRGRVAALLELGSGFNPEFTGRENVYLNAAIRGLTRQQTDAKFEQIAAFADIGDFIEQPTKTYSSGMLVRLAFAASVCVEPEVLIVDEALSVGDVFFQQKCFRRLREIQERGTSLLFVSHDTSAVQNLCDRAILLKDGAVAFEGVPEEAVSRYFAISSGKAAAEAAPSASASAAPAQQSGRFRSLKEEILAHNILPSAKSRHGEREMEVMAAAFLNERGQHAMSVEMLKAATIHLLVRANHAIHSPSAGLHLFDRMNNVVFAAGTRQRRTRFLPLAAGEERIVTFQLTLAVQPGPYTFNVGCGEASADGPNMGYIQDRHEGLGPVDVYYQQGGTWPFYGIAALPIEVRVQD